MKKIDTPNDIENLIKKWKAHFNGDVLFGHLDIVREDFSDRLYVVDPGSFPEFVHYTSTEGNANAVEAVCNLILEQFKNGLSRKDNQQYNIRSS